MTVYNVIADNWINGKYCLSVHVATREEAQQHADRYTERYEGKSFANGKGRYPCKNFRVVEVK